MALGDDTSDGAFLAELRARIQRGRMATPETVTVDATTETATLPEKQPKKRAPLTQLSPMEADQAKEDSTLDAAAALKGTHHPEMKALAAVLNGLEERGVAVDGDLYSHDPIEDDDKCEVCGEPQSDGMDMVCCDTLEENLGFCEKWYHPKCISIELPPTNHDWLCKSCANNQFAILGLAAPVLECGFVIKPSEEGIPADLEKKIPAKAKAAATKQIEDEESIGSNDSVESDEDFVDEDVADEDVADDEDDDIEELYADPSPKKKCSIPVNKSRGNRASTTIKEEGEKYKIRTADERPTTARQTNDSLARIKLNAIEKNMTKLQFQTLPVTRSDDYNPGNAAHQDLNIHEQHFPWLAHGACCMTTLDPNRDGEPRHKRPELHMWVGSEASKQFVCGLFEKENGGTGTQNFKVIVHTNFLDYQNAVVAVQEKKKGASKGGKRKRR